MNEIDLNRTTLEKKLLDTILYQEDVEGQKKASNASFNEELKGCKEKISALASALHSGETHPLLDAFDPVEVDVLLGVKG